MDLVSIVIIAVALSMDAFAVSITNGIIIKNICLKNHLKIALFFGLFQGVMPVIGWAGGSYFRSYIELYDHWLAFGLLAIIGGKMIHEAFSFEEKEKAAKTNCLHFPTLLLMSVATSIDALAAGISFAVLDVDILMPAVIIGLITALMSFIGIKIGDTVGHLFENRIEIIGGLMLIAIGVKVLVEHLVKGC